MQALVLLLIPLVFLVAVLSHLFFISAELVLLSLVLFLFVLLLTGKRSIEDLGIPCLDDVFFGH